MYEIKFDKLNFAILPVQGKLLEGTARPTLASGLPVNDCYEVILPEINIGEWVGYNWPFITSLSVPFRFLFGTDSMQFLIGILITRMVCADSF